MRFDATEAQHALTGAGSIQATPDQAGADEANVSQVAVSQLAPDQAGLADTAEADASVQSGEDTPAPAKGQSSSGSRARSSFLGGDLGAFKSSMVIWPIIAATLTASHLQHWGAAPVDTDDAMRMVQIRDLLAGQPWFDLVQHRLDPPSAIPMHWSRFADIGPAALILAARQFVSPAGADMFAQWLWPLLLLGMMLWLVAQSAEMLGGKRAIVPALLLVIGSGLFNFQPFRMDHHGTQIVALVACALCVSLMPRRPGSGVAAALAIAVMMSIGLETLPYAALLCVLVALDLIRRGEAARWGAMLFGGGLAVLVPLLALAVMPAAQLVSSSCDALSAPSLAGLMIGGAGLAGVASVIGRWPTPLGRAAAMAPVALAVAGAFLWLGRPCLAGPYGGLSQELRDRWLVHVAEAQGLLGTSDGAALAHLDVYWSIWVVLVAAAATWIALDSRLRSWPAVVFGSLALAASVIGLWQIRSVIVFVVPLAAPLLGALIALWVVRRTADNEWQPMLAPIAAVVLLGIPWTGWKLGTPALAALTRPASDVSSPAASAVEQGSCMVPSRYAPLASLPSGLVLAPIDNGSFILNQTSLSVIGAPYHRYGDGILFAIKALSADLVEAELMIRAKKVRYVVLCPANEGQGHPGLIGSLAAGYLPKWLKPLPVDPTGLLAVFEVLPPLGSPPAP